MSELETHADVIFVGGTVITMDDAHPTAEAVAVRDGPATKVVDLAGHPAI